MAVCRRNADRLLPATGIRPSAATAHTARIPYPGSKAIAARTSSIFGPLSLMVTSPSGRVAG